MRSTLLTLVHITDSGFPSGGFGHSWGLEYAIGKGWIQKVAELVSWSTDALLSNLITMEGRGLIQAYKLGKEHKYAEILLVDEELAAMRPSLYQAVGAAQVGRSFLNNLALYYGDTEFIEMNTLVKQETINRSTVIQQPVIWGAACGWLGIPDYEALEVHLFNTLRQWANVAMRTIPLGQTESNRYLVYMMKLLKNTDFYEIALKNQLEGICPGMDIAAMGHENLEAKYFRT
ncbi:urease accessory UreF family protein [Candidatus Haliotispira prima]|uniref:Urease accessory protein UreF n=1 Tax=Candidatus Haliotispira prima TaxID=3034016 RepID=A0ABY8MKI3_9SPIO|nr:urease accessory UreF family protein [Candidatus Haliotispira prima]